MILGAALLGSLHCLGPSYAVCEYDDAAKNEADGLRMVNALLAGWLEKGVLPVRLKDLPKEVLPDTLEFWSYRQHAGSPLGFEISIGNYDVCDWEHSIWFQTEWRAPKAAPVRAEAFELLRILVRRYLADGAWPASHEALDLPAGWGQQGVWQYEAPRPGLRSWDDMIPGMLFIAGPLGPELVLEFDPPDFYVDT